MRSRLLIKVTFGAVISALLFTAGSDVARSGSPVAILDVSKTELMSPMLVRDRRPWRPHGNDHGPAHWQDKLEQQIKRGIRRERRRRVRRAIVGGIIRGAIANGIRGEQQRRQCNEMRYHCERGSSYACDDYYRFCR